MVVFTIYNNENEPQLITGYTLTHTAYKESTLTFNAVGKLEPGKKVHIVYHNERTGATNPLFSGVITKRATRRRRRTSKARDGGTIYKKLPDEGIFEYTAQDYGWLLRSEYIGTTARNLTAAINRLLEYDQYPYRLTEQLTDSDNPEFHFDGVRTLTAINKILMSKQRYLTFKTDGSLKTLGLNDTGTNYTFQTNTTFDYNTLTGNTLTELTESLDISNLYTRVDFMKNKYNRENDQDTSSFQERLNMNYLGHLIPSQELYNQYGQIIKIVKGDYEDKNKAYGQEAYNLYEELHPKDTFTLTLPFIPTIQVLDTVTLNDKYGDTIFSNYWVETIVTNENNLMTLQLTRYHPLPPSEWLYVDPDAKKDTGTGSLPLPSGGAGGAGTITVRATAQACGDEARGYVYGVWYTKTWVNHCPLCGANGVLRINPKGVYEVEITCGRCDADFSGCSGYEKLCNWRGRLTPA